MVFEESHKLDCESVLESSGGDSVSVSFWRIKT